MALLESQRRPMHHCTDQALPKIGFGTHFSVLSNILPKGADVVIVALEVSAWQAGVLEELDFAAGTDVFDAAALLVILRFWKAFLMPLPDPDLATKRVEEDAGEEDEEMFLQLCWFGARWDGQKEAEHCGHLMGTTMILEHLINEHSLVFFILFIGADADVEVLCLR